MEELWINNYQIELADGIPFSVDFDIADIKDPSKRKRSVSKVIEIPLTQNNLIFFQANYSLNVRYSGIRAVSFQYDPRRIYQARYYRKGTLQFFGYVQLLSIKLSNEKQTAEIVLFSTVKDLFADLDNITVPMLGWSEYDHVLTTSNIANSWSVGVIKNGVLTVNFDGTNPDGFGYIYPLIDYGYSNAEGVFYDNEIYPHVYLWEVLQKAFARKGLTIQSAWLDSRAFKRRVWGYGGGDKFQFSQAVLNERLVNLTADADFTFTLLGNATSPSAPINNINAITTFPIGNIGDTTVTVNNDDLTQFDTTEGVLFIQNNGYYRARVEGEIDFSTSFLDNFFGLGYNMTSNIIIQVYQNDNLILTTGTEGQFSSSAAAPNPPTGVVSGTFTFDKSIDYQANTGDQIEVVVIFQTNATLSYGSNAQLIVELDYKNDLNFINTCISKDIQTGDTVQIAQYLPSEKVSTLIKDLILWDNLYVSEPNEDGVVRIEPLQNYYSSSNDTDDWTDLIDLEQPIEIEPLSNSQPKVFNFRFAQDRDYFKQLYFDEFGIDYGDFRYVNPAFFATGESNIDLSFSIACPVQTVENGLIIPRFKELSGDIFKPKKGKPKVYYYQGLITSNWTLRNSINDFENNRTSYPLFHHLNSLQTPTSDMLFGTPSKVFYNATAYTNNTIFRQVYDRTIREFTSADGKLFRAYFRLTELTGEFFRKLKMYDGTVWRLNKVSDADISQDKSYQVELVKVLEGRQPKPSKDFNLPKSDIPFSGGGARGLSNVKEIGGDYIVEDGDEVLSATATLTVTLPIAELLTGGARFLTIKNGLNTVVRIEPQSGDLIDGSEFIELRKSLEAVTLQVITDNNWIII